MTYQKIFHIVIALLTVLFICSALGYQGWKCNGSFFSGECGEHMKITGYLLLAAGIFSFISAALVCLSMSAYRKWLDIVVIIITIITGIFASVGVFYYYNHEKYWSPLLSSVAMTLSIIFICMMIQDLPTAPLDSDEVPSPSFT